MNVAFNGVKAVQVALLCKDRQQCECSHLLKTLRPLVGVNSSVNCLPGGLYRSLSTSTMGTGGTLNTPTHTAHNSAFTSAHNTPGGSVNISITGSGSGRVRVGMSPRVVGNLNSALNKGGRNSKDYAKIKGINLNTQTMLKIADTDTIMNILYSLDNTAFGLMGSNSESSNLNAHADVGGSDSQLNNHMNAQHLRVLTSNRLYTVIEAADPTSSFLDISLALDEPVEEVR